MKMMKVRILSILLAVSLGMGAFLMQKPLKAEASRILTLEAAKSMAVANSSKIEQLEYRLDTKEVSLKQAVKSIRLKKESMESFRWTPLLSFKLPEQPNLSEAFEFTYKPLEIQSEIDSIRHQITDQKLEEYEKVCNQYITIIVKERSIQFNEERLSVMEDTLKKNQAKLLTGEANQSDIDSMKKDIDSITSKVASDKRAYEAAKKKLSNFIGLDITTGYSFVNPFMEADMDRSHLEMLTTYTLDRNQDYYDASMEERMAKISLETSFNLMNGHYNGNEMSLISGFVRQVLNGQEVDKKAFKKKYDEFLKVVEEPWEGYKWIWFIPIPKIWFKGDIDGVRYVEDEPYSLYEAALNYQESRKAKGVMKEELTYSVEDAFNNYISVRNSYQSYVKQVAERQESLKKYRILNQLGQMTYDEYKTAADEYEALQNDMFDSLAEYTSNLYSFDRLTCGGVSTYMAEADAGLFTAGGGESYVEEEYVEGANYYIRPIVQEDAFEIGINIPTEFPIEITDFEFWCDEIQLGERTDIKRPIRHLSISKKSIETAKIRLYNNGEFVDDCEIDPESYSGPLEIVAAYREVSSMVNEVGAYTIGEGINGIAKLEITFSEDEIKFYRPVLENGKPLSSGKLIKAGESFRYLPIIQGGLEDITLEFYGINEELLYRGYFDTTNRKVFKIPVDE